MPFERRQEFAESLPLDMNICMECGHVQNRVVANPEILFRHYLSRPAAVNPVLSDAYQSYAQDLLSRVARKGRGFLVEIGSNDGLFAKFLQDKGMKALGVEPALNLAEQAQAAGLETLPEFFSPELAREIRSKHGFADVVISNHTLANIDDFDAVMAGVKELLALTGTFVLQTFYLRDVLQQNLLENFNHEHLSYFYVRTLKRFFARHKMELFDVLWVPAKGGSIRCFVKWADGPYPVSPSVQKMIGAEEDLGMQKPETYLSITRFIERMRSQLQALLGKSESEKKTVAAYGTSIGATTFTYQYGLGKMIKFFVDDDPYRQNLVSPGFHIPVVSPAELLKQKPDYVLVMAPLYAENIMKKNSAYAQGGGRFVLIWPEFELR